MYDTLIAPDFTQSTSFQHFPADTFPTIRPIHWLYSHFAVGGWSPLQRLSGMLTAHMTQITPHSGFTWHPHRGLEIYTWVLEGTIYHEDTTGGKGEIGPGEFQRMFSGNYIEHQELNRTDAPVRVIQIWFAADPKYRLVEPHYQQPTQNTFPVHHAGDATVMHLIGDGSPMEQHMQGRLTEMTIPAGGTAPLERPRPGEDLFLYVTNGIGTARNGHESALGQYDVILARPNSEPATLTALDTPLHILNFYLPSFLNS